MAWDPVPSCFLLFGGAPRPRVGAIRATPRNLPEPGPAQPLLALAETLPVLMARKRSI